MSSHELSSPSICVELERVYKRYRTYPTPRHRLQEMLSGGRRQYARETIALQDISLKIDKGERLGIVGENGSGKSTLLKILAKVLSPTDGQVKIQGRVSALLELGAGFNPELPGIENIKQFGLLHGMNSEEINAALPEIVKFSELREAIDHPVKTYSSGMAVRLGFACAVHVQPDILIVDEALSVGDAYFQNKCLQKIKSMLDQGTTFIYVTHAADSIRSLCTRGLWLHKGVIRQLGSSSSVGSAYQSEVFSKLVRSGFAQEVPADEAPVPSQDLAPKQDRARQNAFKERVDALRTGSGEIRISDIVIVDEDGVETDSVGFNQIVRIRIFYSVLSQAPINCALTLGITDTSGRQLLHFSSSSRSLFASEAPLNIPQFMEFSFSNPLCPGEYGVIAGIGVLNEHPQNKGQSIVETVVDYCVGGVRFSVRFPEADTDRETWGVVHTPYSVVQTSLD